MSRHHYRGNFRSPWTNGVEHPAPFTHADIPLPFEKHVRSFGAPVVQVAATVVEYFGQTKTNDGTHQDFTVHIDQVIEVQGAPISLVSVSGEAGKADAFVAVRFGDLTQHAGPIPGLVPGAQLVLRGEYIDTADARPSANNRQRLAVIHFAHAPVGFVEMGGKDFE